MNRFKKYGQKFFNFSSFFEKVTIKIKNETEPLQKNKQKFLIYIFFT